MISLSKDNLENVYLSYIKSPSAEGFYNLCKLLALEQNLESIKGIPLGFFKKINNYMYIYNKYKLWPDLTLSKSVVIDGKKFNILSKRIENFIEKIGGTKRVIDQQIEEIVESLLAGIELKSSQLDRKSFSSLRINLNSDMQANVLILCSYHTTQGFSNILSQEVADYERMKRKFTYIKNSERKNIWRNRLEEKCRLIENEGELLKAVSDGCELLTYNIEQTVGEKIVEPFMLIQHRIWTRLIEVIPLWYEKKFLAVRKSLCNLILELPPLEVYRSNNFERKFLKCHNGILTKL